MDRRPSRAFAAAETSMHVQRLLLARAYAWVTTIAGWIDRFFDRLMAASMRNSANRQARMVGVFARLRMSFVQLTGDCGDLLIERAYVIRRYERFLLRCRCGLVDTTSLPCMGFTSIECYRLITGSKRLLDEIENVVVTYEGRGK
ncbi:hypothetical protein [Caballeronia sp. LZ035]|uniref:hypothetical protein n=1 Tax=Caballeronia sp. LZ035 TaxID=3038568 RepID=UPI0028584BBF|nr:hypothetical protein [Caballeronia sp. LZ035]MDR5756477.1 hypothetical protein [Caballeronia sp. LZ035]